MNNKKEKLKNLIIEKYNKENADKTSKVDLLKPAKDIGNQFFLDFKDELEKSETNKFYEKIENNKFTDKDFADIEKIND